ncbi:NAD(P)-dependent alcohol dehydrogenase [Oculatella sp. LEGE 06141]|uniref:zinc-binding dehydrogenase n=1 Tax=Oculatella sp. LEGE 06141 TaxID=1828648 RepID=UPI00187E9A4E|nr:NAD(P)-dependent alcohol dehydrogenase [Oculatella sp. LEGE 06141]
MKAVIFNRYGAAAELQYTTIEQPQIQPDQMLIKVYATSVNPVDWKIRKGMLKLVTGNRFPQTLGFDVSGEVVKLGDRVRLFQLGDAVYARLNQLPGTAYAEYVAVSESVAAAKPKNMTHTEAAAVPLAALTALQALRNQGQLQANQQVLINGASGGVGTYAVQIAKALDAEVTAVCSSKNVELVQSLGSDRVIDYTQQDITQDSSQYDVIFDAVGKQSFSACKPLLKPNGIYVTTLPTPELFLQIGLTSFLPGKKAKFILVQSSGSDLDYLKDLIETGKVRSVIDRTFPLAEAAAAHTYSESDRTSGKIVLTVSH